ncbi:cation transporter [Clostridium sp. 19966]|uniref:cation diffusion facilitator family transporter n=1 Tax=Clostridium sp. 19966 TaxID=2768166 RepID=UPI0028DF3B47|nr:cation diffusion facilitator family transporter [Clostridium sp. 19966]MDT8718703.1 cation transporter [Clostridium sp. 19966]
MFINTLIKKFIKNFEDTKNETVRTKYGFFAGIIGIVINLILFFIKISVGILTNSIAVTADAFNNLSDSASSLITIIGFKLSNLPADEEHPFGHGRIEYLSALVVSFMVMFVGFQFVKSSFERIFHPSRVVFQLIPFLLILLSMAAKVWLSFFNKKIGFIIDSAALKASALDSLGDVIISAVVAISLIFSLFSSFPLDGYLGILVAALILYSGFTLIKETVNPLLGEAPDAELVKDIKKRVLSYENIIGVHDLIIHNYGPGKAMASIHAEVPSNINIVSIHNVIDRAEREISEKLNLILVIHMDPVNVDDKEVTNTRKQVSTILKKFESIKSIHDFRIVGEGETKNIIFDSVVNSSDITNHTGEIALKKDICTEVKKFHPNYNCVITIDRDFSDL